MPHTLKKHRKDELRDLFLWEYRAGEAPDDLRIQAEKAGLIVIHGCTRTVVFGLGHPDDLEADTSKATLLKGQGAYGRLLAYKTGLLSRAPGESQIVGQFRDAFKPALNDTESLTQNYGTLYRWLSEDNQLVRSHVTHDLQSAYFETIAQRMAPRNTEESVVIVIDEDKKGKLSETTLNLLRQLSSFSHNKPRTIFCTHPDIAVLKKHMPEIERMAQRQTIDSSVQPVVFNDIIEAPYNSELSKQTRHIFYCPSCEKFPESDAKLADRQSEMSAFGTRVILMGGDKTDRKTKGAWTNEIEGVVKPEEITTAQKAKKTENNALIAAGNAACAKAALARDHGKKPLARFIDKPLNEFTHLLGIDTPSAATER